MSADDVRRLRAQQEAQAAQIQRLNMQLQAQNARIEDEDYDPDDMAVDEPYVPQPQYNQVTHDQVILNQLAQEAANRAAMQVQSNIQATQNVQNTIQKRMERLVAEYPAIQEDDSQLTMKAREVYARIASENPSMNEADRYELAVREAASRIGARPVNSPVEDYAASDYTMPAGPNPARGNPRSSKSRLTPNIITNAKLLGINVDPSTPEGKRNLAELSEYSARFNADQDETAFRYR